MPHFSRPVHISICAAASAATSIVLIVTVSEIWQKRKQCTTSGSSSNKQNESASQMGNATSLLLCWRRMFGKRLVGQDNNNCSTRPAEDSVSKVEGYEALIGNTPLIRLPHLSNLIGRHIYVKMESLNPSGSGKDRAALAMIRDAEDNLQKNFEQIHHIVEGTSGSTGIALAALCASRTYRLTVVMPDDQAMEKQTLLKNFGAQVKVVPNCSISNPNHYVNTARLMALEENKQQKEKKANVDDDQSRSASPHKPIKRRGVTIFMNQFENEANWKSHYKTTGPEIFEQTNGLIDAFVMSAGTGGTIAGVAKYLKETTASQRRRRRSWFSSSARHKEKKEHEIKVVLVDPPGSSLHAKVNYGVAFTSQQSESLLRRHRYDTIAEGIGLDRITANFSIAVGGGHHDDDDDYKDGQGPRQRQQRQKQLIDESIQISDQEALDMAHWLLRHEGLFVGSSSAMNIAGAVQVAKSLKENSIVVTIVCDSGQRHLSRFWNQSFIEQKGFIWPSSSSSSSSTNDTNQKERIPNCLQDIS